jgi:hypothetical protein
MATPPKIIFSRTLDSQQGSWHDAHIKAQHRSSIMENIDMSTVVTTTTTMAQQAQQARERLAARRETEAALRAALPAAMAEEIIAELRRGA